MVPLHFIPGSASAVSAAVSLWAKPGPRQRFSRGFLPAAGRLVLESASLKRQCSRWSSGGGQALDRVHASSLTGFTRFLRRALAARHRVEKNRATVPLVVDARGPWDRAARVRDLGPGEAPQSSRADKNTRTRNVTCGNYTSCERRRRGKERSGGRCSGICVQSVKMPASRRRRSPFAGFPDWLRCGETLRPSRTGELRPRDGFSVAAARSRQYVALPRRPSVFVPRSSQ